MCDNNKKRYLLTIVFKGFDSDSRVERAAILYVPKELVKEGKVLVPCWGILGLLKLERDMTLNGWKTYDREEGVDLAGEKYITIYMECWA